MVLAISGTGFLCLFFEMGMKYWRYEMGIPDMDGFPGGWDWRETGVLLVGFILPMEMGKWRRTKGPGMN